MLNQFNFIGNIGRIETKELSGKKLANFSVAISQKTKAGEETLWMNVTAWDKLAATCEQFLSKGKKVFVSGRLSARQYTNKDGNKATAYEVTASQVIFLSPKDTEVSESQNNDGFTDSVDLPF